MTARAGEPGRHAGQSCGRGKGPASCRGGDIGIHQRSAGTPAPAEGAEGLSRAPSWFEPLAGTSLLLLWVCAADGTLLAANRPAAEGCGFSPADQAGLPLWRTGWWAGSSDLQERVRGWCTRVAAGAEPVRTITSFFAADGGMRTVDLTLQRVGADNGGPFHLLVVGVDITDRVSAQLAADAATSAAGRAALGRATATRTADLRALHDAKAGLSRALQLSERVLDNVADGLYGLDADGHVEFVNPAAARITGYRQDQQLGRNQHELIHAHRRDGSPYPVDECPVWRALRTGRMVQADDEVFWRSDGTPVPVELVAVPTVEDGTVTGVVVSFRDLTDRLAAQRQAAELERVSAQAEAQRALSDRLQQALLTPPPQPDHLHLAVRYLPAAHEAQVGGDWYDAFLQPDGATMLVIGDVVGHDSSAAAAMGQLRGVLRALAYDNGEGPAATLTRVERAAHGLAVNTLATAVLARIERRPDAPVTGTRTLRWSSAGHPPPVLLLPDGTCTVLHTPPDLMMGVDPDAPRREHLVDLPDHSTLLLFTDGLVERRDSDLDAGFAALCAALADLGDRPLDELCDTLLARLVPRAGGDDVALLAVRAYPEDRPRPPEAGPNRVAEGID